VTDGGKHIANAPLIVKVAPVTKAASGLLVGFVPPICAAMQARENPQRARPAGRSSLAALGFGSFKRLARRKTPGTIGSGRSHSNRGDWIRTRSLLANTTFDTKFASPNPFPTLPLSFFVTDSPLEPVR